MRKPKTKVINPITRLFFVKDRPNWKPEDGRHPRDFWAVNTTGDYSADCALGVEFARQAIDYINAHDGDELLGWAVFDMIAKPEESLKANRGVVVGFMSEIARHAAYGRKLLKEAGQVTWMP